MPYWEFLWTPEIELHVAEHGVTREEFEDVVCNPRSVSHSRSSGDPIAEGETFNGKFLICVYEVLPDGLTVLPVTAYEPESQS